ncbi:cytosolic protein [Geobacillus sp. BMUD]|uniref:DnaA N-terminal domain-containing protein n=1 Tax=Geobacillus TaxID=129337 RepID=UPI0004DF20E6|nr:DnaA N-terminal domain-containing protein [Geobacillus vulcani]NNU85267.1 cytosolic protein [Geobacillus sp. BMUD]
MKEHTLLWEQVKAKLAQKLSGASFDAWFASTSATVDEDWLIIECVNEIQCEWLQIRYGELIGETVREVFGREMRIFVSVCGERQQIEKRLEQRHGVPMTFRQYMTRLEQQVDELERRIDHYARIIDELFASRPIH